MPSLNKILGINLKYYRFLEGKSQEDYYSKYKLSIKHLANIENGKQNVTLNEVEKIGKALNINPIDLLLFDEKKIIKKKRIDQKQS